MAQAIQTTRSAMNIPGAAPHRKTRTSPNVDVHAQLMQEIHTPPPLHKLRSLSVPAMEPERSSCSSFSREGQSGERWVVACPSSAPLPDTCRRTACLRCHLSRPCVYRVFFCHVLLAVSPRSGKKKLSLGTELSHIHEWNPSHQVRNTVLSLVLRR